ncbi:calcium-binding protein [Amaricoccus tamworthensis]|uniref:calcium-binding protein n=1 Tax=Amaricoccus tamworthensis TaxID=57002 RepID=UPI003C7B6478
MPEFILNDGSTAGFEATAGSFVFVGQNGALSTTTMPAIESSGYVDVTVLGSIYSNYSEAIYHTGGGLNLIVGANGFIGNFANHLDGLYLEDMTLVTVINNGLISTHATAINMAGYVYNEFVDVQGHAIVNTGTISSVFGGGINASTDDVFLSLSNTGEITGAFGVAAEGGAHITNAGRIVGDVTYAFHSASEDAEDTIINSGTMIGMIEMGGGDDRLINRGTVDEVGLGEGDDFYNARNGGMSGDITAGDGNDTLRGGREDDTFRGNAGDDELRGRSGDDWLLGGDGDDSIAGQKGDDFMNGGKGADVFIFASNGGFDTIAKLQSNDTIDLTALGLNRFGKDIKPHIEDAKGGSRIDLTDDFDLSIFVRGSDPDDLKASDFLL